MNPPISYQMLYDKLRSLGFTEKTIPWNGSIRRHFQYQDRENTSIILPDRPTEAAATMHIGAVRTLLLRHGFISETDFVHP